MSDEQTDQEEPYDFGFGRTEPIKPFKAKLPDGYQVRTPEGELLPARTQREIIEERIGKLMPPGQLPRVMKLPRDAYVDYDDVSSLTTRMSLSEFGGSSTQHALERVVHVLLEKLGGPVKLDTAELVYIMNSTYKVDIAVAQGADGLAYVMENLDP